MPKEASRRSCAHGKHDSSPVPRSAVDWPRILVDAVNTPGLISEAYRAFWNYSVGNQLLAMFECLARNIDPGPIHTFKGWLEFGRHVKRGEQAITLCMPITYTSKAKSAGAVDSEDDEVQTPMPTRRRYILRPRWFVLSQTEGKEYVPLALPKWDERHACHRLLIDREPFTHTNGNCQGYARQRSFAVSSVAYLPHRTAFHEIAHIVLGHTQESMGLRDGDECTPRDIREVEAEAVALLCCKSLGLPGEEFSRGYIQHWLGVKSIEERSVHRIFKVADTILKAGYPTEPLDEASA